MLKLPQRGILPKSDCLDRLGVYRSKASDEGDFAHVRHLSSERRSAVAVLS